MMKNKFYFGNIIISYRKYFITRLWVILQPFDSVSFPPNQLHLVCHEKLVISCPIFTGRCLMTWYGRADKTKHGSAVSCPISEMPFLSNIIVYLEHYLIHLTFMRCLSECFGSYTTIFIASHSLEVTLLFSQFHIAWQAFSCSLYEKVLIFLLKTVYHTFR